MSKLHEEALALAKLGFDELPADRKVKIFGTEYARLQLDEGDEFYITRFGWSRFFHILPEKWFLDRQYLREAEKLPGSTGAVYRVPTWNDQNQCINLVIKFSRFAQEVLLHISSAFPASMPQEAIESASWNNPFEEFGTLMDLRRGRFGPPSLRILTNRPLGIYCPAQEYKLWQLGRNRAIWQQHNRLLEKEQGGDLVSEMVHLHEKRQYIMIYEWIKGENAENYYLQGKLTESEMEQLTHRAVRELHEKGFRVLDNKPKHFILRARKSDGELMRRYGKLICALVDFELLQRTSEYVEWLKKHGR